VKSGNKSYKKEERRGETQHLTKITQNLKLMFPPVPSFRKLKIKLSKTFVVKNFLE
jgi:hypothetical protein